MTVLGRRDSAWLATLLVALSFLAGCDRRTNGTDGPRLTLVDMLGGADTVGYARAIGARPFEFPLDDGPHPEFRTEWWYVTGNLAAPDGRDFGFQFTVFRSALAPTSSDGPSAWSTNQVYMAHFALSELSSGTFHAEERVARGAAGLAGATAEPFRVWVEDWALHTVVDDGSSAVPNAENFPLRLIADVDGLELALTLEAGKPFVAQGDSGLSRKGPETGNASHYFSRTRMPAAGRLTTGIDTLELSGLAWFDREWSTSALSDGLVGWDWFALHVDDGWDLMVYRLRRADGSADAFSDGVLVDPRGETIRLAWGVDIMVESTGVWASDVDGTEYPSGWRVRVPSRGWDLIVDPALPDQELDLSFRYWEGAVRLEGSGEGGASVAGRGYVELTGYAGVSPGR